MHDGRFLELSYFSNIWWVLERFFSQNNFKWLELFYGKKRPEKTGNIRKMRVFETLPEEASMQRPWHDA